MNKEVIASLMEVKGVISEEYRLTEESDSEQLSYLIDLIDYLILGLLPLDDLIYSQLIEEMELAGLYQSNKNILSSLVHIYNIGKQLGFDNHVGVK